MTKKIVNIVIFAVAILGCIFSLWFALSFDDSKKDIFGEVGNIEKQNKQMLDEFKTVTIETLPGFVTKYQEEATNINKEVKDDQLQKDILYTYMTQLEELADEAAFEDYKSNFPSYSKSLFAKSNNAQYYIDGFNAVSGYKALDGYISKLSHEYDRTKQSFLEKKDYARSLTNFVKRTSEVNNTVSESKKLADLETLQQDAKSALSEKTTLNTATMFLYIVFFMAIALTIIFSLFHLATNIKNSYKAILAVLVLCLVFIIGYFTASPDLSKSAIAAQASIAQVKWIQAGILTFYFVFFGTILAILVAPIINKLKKA